MPHIITGLIAFNWLLMDVPAFHIFNDGVDISSWLLALVDTLRHTEYGHVVWSCRLADWSMQCVVGTYLLINVTGTAGRT